MKTALFLLFFLLFGFTTASTLPAKEFLHDVEKEKVEENGEYKILLPTDASWISVADTEDGNKDLAVMAGNPMTVKFQKEKDPGMSATSASHSYRQQGSSSSEIDNQRPRRPPPPPPRRPATPPPRQPPPPSLPEPGFDFFLLVLQWPNAFCKSDHVTCRPSPPKQYFTIHGLWPQSNKGGSVNFCHAKYPMTDAILEELRKELLEYWPRLFSADQFDRSKKLWHEQWTKHGSCSSDKFPPKEYLQTAINLGKKYGPLVLKKMEEKVIKPDGTTTYNSEKVLEAIKEATETSAIITCNKDNWGQLQLNDIRLCVKDDGVTLQNCTKKSSTCNADFIFASKPTKFASSILEAEGMAVA